MLVGYDLYIKVDGYGGTDQTQQLTNDADHIRLQWDSNGGNQAGNTQLNHIFGPHNQWCN